MKQLKLSITILLLIFLTITVFTSCKKDEATAPSGTAPQAPTLVSPVNKLKNLSIPPTLTWHVSINALTYTLQLSTDSSFSIIVYSESGLTITSKAVNGLNSYITYYWRVNAINSYGTSVWSSVWHFTTSIGAPCPGIPFLTYAGKIYNTVQIGSQCWLKENLDVGIMIDSMQNQTNNSTIEKYCYNNDPNNCNTYGGLYQWNEAMQYSRTPGTQGICPPGWHIPTMAEFQTLSMVVGGYGNALKALGQGTGSGAGTNKSGFSALLSGYRYGSGTFEGLGNSTYFWSSTDGAYFMYMFFNDNVINYGVSSNKEIGLCIRCVKD